MRVITMTKRVVKQIVGDKRSLGLLIVAPILVLFLLNIILNSSVVTPRLDTIGVPKELNMILEHSAKVSENNNKVEAVKRLKDRKIDGVLEYRDDILYVTVEGAETSITAGVKKAVSGAFSDYVKKRLANIPGAEQMGIRIPENKFIYINGSEDMNTFDSIAPLMMGFFIFFFVFLLAGVSFLRERISGTLDRLLATPIKRLDIVLGYFFGFGIFVTLQTIIIQLFMVYGLGITIKGNSFLVLLINMLLAAGSLSLGTLLSAFAKNEFQLFQFIPVVIVPQMLFSGIFSLREAPIWVKGLSQVFPLTYGADALRNVVVRGEGFNKVWVDILILSCYALGFIVLNSLVLKKYRKL